MIHKKNTFLNEQIEYFAAQQYFNKLYARKQIYLYPLVLLISLTTSTPVGKLPDPLIAWARRSIGSGSENISKTVVNRKNI